MCCPSVRPKRCGRALDAHPGIEVTSASPWRRPSPGCARRLHAQIHALKNRGIGPYLIARELWIDPKTAQRHLSFATDDNLHGQGHRQRATGLDAHADYLARRYAEGARGGVLQKELEARGVKVSERTVRRFASILLTCLGAEHLAEWIAQAPATALKETMSFAAGLLADWNTATAAATLNWSSGNTEGQEPNHVQ